MSVQPQPDSFLLLIDGREALPVRAIPLVVDWDYLPPDALASALMHQRPPRHNKLGALHAYHLVAGKPQRVEPWEWGSVVADLDAFEVKVRRAIPPDGQGGDDEAFQVWRELVLAKLPAAAFVWLVDFEREFAGGWARRALGVGDEPASPPAPSYSPVSMTRFRHVVVEGFSDRPLMTTGPSGDDWTSPIRYEDLPHRIAKLRYPDDSLRYGACRLELEGEIDLAVVRGELTVRNALTGGRVAHAYPGAVVWIDDLRPFLGALGMSVPHDGLVQSPAAERIESPVPSPGSTEVRWTVERIDEAREMRDELRDAGVRGYMKQTAVHFGVSVARLRDVLGRAKKPVKATPWSALNQGIKRTR